MTLYSQVLNNCTVSFVRQNRLIKTFNNFIEIYHNFLILFYLMFKRQFGKKLKIIRTLAPLERILDNLYHYPKLTWKISYNEFQDKGEEK